MQGGASSLGCFQKWIYASIEKSSDLENATALKGTIYSDQLSIAELLTSPEYPLCSWLIIG